MGLRDRLSSALTGVPASSDVQPRRNRDDGRSVRPSRSGQTRRNAPATNTGPRPSRLAIEANPASLSEPRFGRQQLAIEDISSLTITDPPQQISSTETIVSVRQRQTLHNIGATRPALRAARTAPLYGINATQEISDVDQPRRPPIGSSRQTRVSGPNRAHDLIAPGTPERIHRDELPPLTDREILDVTDEDDEIPGGASPQGIVLGTAPQNYSQQSSRPSQPSGQTSTLRQNDPSTRLPTCGRRGQGSTNAYPRRSSSQATVTTTHTAPERGTGSRSGSTGSRGGSFGAGSMGRSTENSASQSQALYLGVFDLEEARPSTQQRATTNRAGSFQQRGSSSRSSSFGQQSISSRTRTSARLTTTINHGYHMPSVCSYPIGWNLSRGAYFGDYGWYSAWSPWGYRYTHLPWCPHAHVSLSSQTVFTEVSTDYFEQESPPDLSLNIDTGLGVIQRYYNGWRDAYTEALSLSMSGNSGISAADRARIEANRDGLQSRQDEAVRRLRSGDQSVVQETLDQVKMDRQMAVDMPVAQIQWATPWIKEVWINEHGEIPY